VLGVVHGAPGVLGALGVGAASAPAVGVAWRKALAEAFAARAAGAKLALLEPDRTYGPAGGGVVTFEDHIRYYADPQRAAAADFLVASPERVSVADVPPLEGKTAGERIETLCARVVTAGSSAYAVDVTSPDVAELGLAVAKVVAPELCALDVDHDARFLGARRLYRGAAELGLAPAALADGAVNPEPHPFP
jgi:ribosomal protein S12 methylthiotransferase accessory factor